MTDTIDSPIVQRDDEPTGSRRRLLRLAGAAAAGAATAAVVRGGGASAADGGNVIIGQVNIGTTQTALAAFSPSVATLGVTGGAGGAFYAVVNDPTKPAVVGDAAIGAGIGVHGEGGPTGIGVRGHIASGTGTAVWGDTQGTGTGVTGSSNGGTAVRGLALTGVGVSGTSVSNDGLRGTSTDGYGLNAQSTNSLGGYIQGGMDGLIAKGARYGVTVDHVLNFNKAVVAPPAAGTFVAGDLVESQNDGSLWVCVAGGSPGKWLKVGGTGTAGSFHPVTPFRCFDTRLMGGGALSIGSSRVVDPTISIDPNTGLPSADLMLGEIPGQTAISYNLTAISGTNPKGFLAVTPGDATTYQASSINWSTANQVIANASVVKLSPTATIRVFAGGSGAAVHFIVDVVGYYR